MTNITTREERTIELPTDLGPITVLFHHDASCYVKFGAQPGYEPDLPPLKLPRGIELRGSGHFNRTWGERTLEPSGPWRPAGAHSSAYQYYYRQGSSHDVTTKQFQTARDAIIRALDAWSATDTGRAQLVELQRLAAHSDAIDYRSSAEELRQLADACEDWASALEAGTARISYRRVRLSSGAEERVRLLNVRNDGQNLDCDPIWWGPLREVSMPYGVSKYGGSYVRHEEDRS